MRYHFRFEDQTSTTEMIFVRTAIKHPIKGGKFYTGPQSPIILQKVKH